MTPTIEPDSPAVRRGDSAALALLGAMLLALAVVMGVSMSAAASGAFQEIGRTVKAAFGPDEALQAAQRRQGDAITGIEGRVHDVAAEVGGLTSRAHLARYHDAAVSDRFAMLETDIAALTAEIRVLRAARNEVVAPAPPSEQVDRLEATAATAGSDIVALRSSLVELAGTHRNDIAGLAQTHRLDIADITNRVHRIERAIATRDLTGSIRMAVRKKKVRNRRPVTVVRGPVDVVPFPPSGRPMAPALVMFSQ